MCLDHHQFTPPRILTPHHADGPTRRGVAHKKSLASTASLERRVAHLIESPLNIGNQCCLCVQLLKDGFEVLNDLVQHLAIADRAGQAPEPLGALLSDCSSATDSSGRSTRTRRSTSPRRPRHTAFHCPFVCSEAA